MVFFIKTQKCPAKRRITVFTEKAKFSAIMNCHHVKGINSILLCCLSYTYLFLFGKIGSFMHNQPLRSKMQ